MEPSVALPRQIQQALGRGCTVVTANRRAARALRRGFDLRQRSLGLAHWEPPAILSWDAWLGSLWHRLLLDGHAPDPFNPALLLTSTQEHTLWHDLIVADQATGGAANSLRPIDSLASLAAGAWGLLHAYRGRGRLQSSIAGSDTRAFARWAADFDRRSARSRLLTEAQLPEALRAAFAEEIFTTKPPAPGGLLLVGFDSRTPAQSALLDAIAATGTSIEEHTAKLTDATPSSPSTAVESQWSTEETPGPDVPPSATPCLVLVAAPDEYAELAACARWLRARLAQQPASRIAVIVPDIEAERAEIDRVFRQALAPELEDIAAPANSGPFEFSLGVPLANTPMVATALDILRWATGPLPLDRVSTLLLSPHFAATCTAPGTNGATTGPEYLARAEFDAFVLRQQHLLQPRIALDALLALASSPKHGAADLPTLLHCLRALHPLINRREFANRNRTCADWVEAIHELLDAAGWASAGRGSSLEFQTRRKWESALDELATLDFDSASGGTRVPFAAALDALERIAAQTLFAPESRHAPIQIMGPLESAGSSFDTLWFLRASDLAWPSRTAPNPLLPWLLQRDLAMPGADLARDTAHARRITERIAASAPTVLFSYAQQSSAEGTQRPSPVVTGLAATGLTLESRSSDEVAPVEPAPAPIVLDTFSDDIPIPSPPDRVLEGGASILQSQAACGFRAFAEKRLSASALRVAPLGLDPGQRGSLVHAILESFWAQVETQAALQRLTPEERDGLLGRCIDAALAEQSPNPAPGWSRAYLLSERLRLLSLLRSWLDFEANQRAPFTVLAREEALRDVRIGPLRLNLRVDRIDRIQFPSQPDESQPDESQPDESQCFGEMLLDYKTGRASPADWLGERPDAPQLPLYAVVANRAGLAAIAFAGVRSGKDMAMLGYQAHDHILPKANKLKAPTLQAQIDQWRVVLTALAEDFHSGLARVSPKQYPKTCSHCDQRLLCRLDPATLDPNPDEDSDPDSQNISSDSTSTEATRG